MTNQLGPYWSSDNLKIYNTDCLYTLGVIKPSVIITSPPYNADKDYGGDDDLDLGAYFDFLSTFIQTAYMAQPKGGWLIINSAMWVGSRPKEFVPSRIIEFCRIAGYDLKDWITWVKGATLESCETNSTAWGNFPTTPSIRSGIEPVMIFRKGWSEPTAKDMTLEEWTKWTVGVWNIKPVTKSWHPAPFPYTLVYRLVKLYAAEGDLICDPFMGTGTVLKVARDLGRFAIGIESNKTFCDKAIAELQQFPMIISPHRLVPNVKTNGKPEQTAMDLASCV